MPDPDYMEKAVEVAAKAMSVLFFVPGGAERVVRAVDPIIAEHHRAEAERERDEAVDLLEAERRSPGSIERAEEFAAGLDKGRADERARVEEQLTSMKFARAYLNAYRHQDVASNSWVKEVQRSLKAAIRALNSEADNA
jgi:hypothetical protein